MLQWAYECIECGTLANSQGKYLSEGQIKRKVKRPPRKLRTIWKSFCFNSQHNWKRVGTVNA